MRSLAFLVTAAALAAPPLALAGPAVTLNGVNITGVANQRFENVNVIIDDQGNLEIQAKGYAARVAGSPAPATSATSASAPVAPRPAAPAPGPAVASTAVASNGSGTAQLTRRYFLATEQSQPDGTQYDVEVFINASWIRVLRSADPPWVGEITRFLRPGSNKITFAATKRRDAGERRFFARDVTLKVVVGEGNVGGDQVMIDEPLVVMTRTAAEVDDKVEEFVFEAR